MSGKRQKLPTKRGRASEHPTPNYDVTRFVNEGTADRLGTICKNRSFIKEKGFHHPDDFFRKTIAAKGWRALYQPPHLAAMSVVREFYANLASHVVKKVRVRGVLVDFSAESINHYYNLDHVPSERFDRLYERPDYPEVIRVLTNGRGEWKLNSEGQAIHFRAKNLAFIPKVWHHFITSRLIPTMNVCEVTAKRALLNYAIIQDIPFDVGQVIEDAILHNQDAKMNLGHPFLIYGLCKRAGVPLDDNEAWLHPIKAYQSRGTNRVSHDLKGPMIPVMSPRTRTSFTTIKPVLDPWAIPRGILSSPRPTHLHHHHRSPQRQLTPVLPPTSRTRCSPLLSALMPSRTRPRSTESSSHRTWRRSVLICVRCWPTRPLFFSSSSPSRPSLLRFSHSTSRHRSDPSITRGIIFTHYCSFLASEDTGYFCLGGGGVWVILGFFVD